MHIIILWTLAVLLSLLIGQTLKWTTMEVIPSFKKWDWYDVNLEDDGVFGDTFVQGTPVNFALPLPADAEDPGEIIQVKAILCRFVNPNRQIQGATSDAGTDLNQVCEISYGMFEFNETTEDSEAYRDELKEALHNFHIDIMPPVRDDAANYSAGSHYNNIQHWTVFEDAIDFPLNVFVKMALTLGTASVFLDESAWNFRIYYKIKRMRLGMLGRAMALIKQTLSA